MSPFSAQKLWSIEPLPSKEQLRCTRLILRHLHYFSNHLLPEDCAMNDLKRYNHHYFYTLTKIVHFATYR